MGLSFSGRSEPTETGLSVQAKDAATNAPVSVKISHEALHNYGLDSAMAKAEEKYDQGFVEADGGVWVRVGDFQ
jgi:hypothetical protein